MPAPSLRRRRSWSVAVDLAVAAWVALWLVLGMAAASEVRSLSAYSDPLLRAAEALDTAGSGLQSLGRVPLVGDGPERLGDEVQATADEVRSSVGDAEDRIDDVGGLVGFAVAAIPTVPVLAVHLPVRLRRGREAAAARRLLASMGEDRMVELLARRAVDRAPYRVLAAASADPWRDLEEGRYDRLADAELGRLGLVRTGARRRR